MTKKEATFKARQIAKQTVRNYFNSEPKETFNWAQFGSLIVKKELSNAFKLYVPFWNMLTKRWCVILLNGNKIVSE